MTYPTTPKFSSISFRSREYNLSSESITGRTQVRSLNSQRWEFTGSYPAMTRADFSPVLGFIMAQRGRRNAFTITLPVLSDNPVTGTVTTSASADAGDSSVGITGLTGTLSAGDIFKFGNHDKVYMATADRSGNGTLSFTPPLLENVGSAVSVIVDNVPVTVRLANDIQEFALGEAKLYRFEVDFIEAI